MSEQRPVFVDEQSGAKWDAAIALMEQGKWNEACAALSDLDSIEPDQPKLINKIGVCLAEVNDLDGAEKEFQRSLGADPHYATAMSNLGNVALQRGDAARAVEFYQKAIQMDPGYAIAYHNLSAAFKKLGKIDKAVAALKKSRSIEMRGEHVRGYPAAGGEPARRGLGGCVTWTIVTVFLVVAIIFLR
jgi:predicted Zn-dependent protease